MLEALTGLPEWHISWWFAFVLFVCVCVFVVQGFVFVRFLWLAISVCCPVGLGSAVLCDVSFRMSGGSVWWAGNST